MRRDANFFDAPSLSDETAALHSANTGSQLDVGLIDGEVTELEPDELNPSEGSWSDEEDENWEADEDLLSFEEGDDEIIEACKLAIRKLVSRPDIDPEVIRDAGSILMCMARFPVPTPEFSGSISAKIETESGSAIRRIAIQEGAFRLLTVDIYDNDGVYSSTAFEVGVGWSERSDPGMMSELVDEWLSEFLLGAAVSSEIDTEE